MTHPAYDAIRTALAELPTDVPEIRPALEPIIPPRARAGWFTVRQSAEPHQHDWGNGIKNTLAVSVISPKQGFEAASDDLAEATDLVLGLLARAPALVIERAEFGAYNDTFFCYTVTAIVFTTTTLET